MNRATPQMRKFAKRLMAYETPRSKSFKTTPPAPFHVTDKLRPHLAMLLGNGGFRGLLSRALVLATAEVSWLRAVRVSENGALEGFEVPHARLDPAEFLEGRVVLLAQLLGLLVAFIGPSLTLRLLGEIWPQISPSDMNFGNGGRNAKTK